MWPTNGLEIWYCKVELCRERCWYDMKCARIVVRNDDGATWNVEWFGIMSEVAFDVE